jgi:hypothetical protein
LFSPVEFKKRKYQTTEEYIMCDSMKDKNASEDTDGKKAHHEISRYVN